MDGGLSEPVITEVVMNLSDQPIAPDASVSDAQTLEDVAINLPLQPKSLLIDKVLKSWF